MPGASAVQRDKVTSPTEQPSSGERRVVRRWAHAHTSRDESEPDPYYITCMHMCRMSGDTHGLEAKIVQPDYYM